MLPTLPQVPERFNRKERNPPTRNILLKRHNIYPPLTTGFHWMLQRKIAVEVQSTAGWETAYYINWSRQGACFYIKGGVVVNQRFRNPPFSAGYENDVAIRKLVRSNEDADLLIADMRSMIIVGAKADSQFTITQIESKLVRLILLHD